MILRPLPILLPASALVLLLLTRHVRLMHAQGLHQVRKRCFGTSQPSDSSRHRPALRHTSAPQLHAQGLGLEVFSSQDYPQPPITCSNESSAHPRPCNTDLLWTKALHRAQQLAQQPRLAGHEQAAQPIQGGDVGGGAAHEGAALRQAGLDGRHVHAGRQLLGHLREASEATLQRACEHMSDAAGQTLARLWKGACMLHVHPSASRWPACLQGVGRFCQQPDGLAFCISTELSPSAEMPACARPISWPKRLQGRSAEQGEPLSISCNPWLQNVRCTCATAAVAVTISK